MKPVTSEHQSNNTEVCASTVQMITLVVVTLVISTCMNIIIPMCFNELCLRVCQVPEEIVVPPRPTVKKQEPPAPDVTDFSPDKLKQSVIVLLLWRGEGNG